MTCRSRTLICDSRQQAGKHEHKNEWWESEGVPTLRCKLPFGDYAWMYPVSVDSKKDIYELAQNIDQQHDRFRRECVGARDAGCQLVVLVENEDGVDSLDKLASWNETPSHYSMRRRASGNMNARRIQGVRLAKACATMEAKYGVRFEFCSPGESAQRILDILGGDET